MTKTYPPERITNKRKRQQPTEKDIKPMEEHIRQKQTY